VTRALLAIAGALHAINVTQLSVPVDVATQLDNANDIQVSQRVPDDDAWRDRARPAVPRSIPSRVVDVARISPTAAAARRNRVRRT
jgi:hypothetical protein